MVCSESKHFRIKGLCEDAQQMLWCSGMDTCQIFNYVSVRQVGTWSFPKEMLENHSLTQERLSTLWGECYFLIQASEVCRKLQRILPAIEGELEAGSC